MMGKSGFLRSGSGLLAIALAAATQPGLAQELEEVLVTARKVTENLQRVPVAVTAITQKTISEAGLLRLQDVSTMVPNMAYNENISNKATNFSLRGITSAGGLGNDPAIGVYVDEVYISRDSGFNQDLLDIQQVEVLRGPQGTLYGRNTTVGAINVTTRKPGREFEGQALLDLGDYDYQRYGLLLNGPLGDTVAGKISLVHTERDGYLDNTYGGTVNTVDYSIGRGQMLWTPGENWDVLLTADYREDDSDGNNLITREQGQPLDKDYEVSIPDSGSEDVQAKGLSLRIGYDMGEYQLTSITSMNELDEDYVNDQDWTPLTGLTGNDSRDVEQWSQELRISSPTDQDFSWVGGLYAYHQEFETFNQAVNGPDTILFFFGRYDLVGTGALPSDYGIPWDEAVITATSTIEGDSYAAFFNGNYAFSDQWSTSFGVRYTQDKKDLDYQQVSDELASFIFPNRTLQDDIDDDEVTPTLSLNFQASEDMMLYAKYSRGYKAGGFNNSISSAASLISFEPETMDAYELGMKSTWMDNRVRLNLAIFEMKYEDKQESSFVQQAGFVQSNAGEATSSGFEVEFDAALTDVWSISGGLGYAEAEYDEYVVDATTDHSGNTLVRAPEWTANLGTQYTWAIGAALELTARADYFYQDDFFTQANNDPFFAGESMNLLSARLTLGDVDETWQVAAWGRNLGDEDSINTIDGPSGFFPTYHYSLIAPRTYGLEVQYFF